MEFAEFIHAFDEPGTVVLLEGKRKVLPEDGPKLIALGSLLASNSVFMRFRSGNAPGADHYFSTGIAEVAPHRLEVITPYAGHRQAENLAYTTFPLDQINVAEEPEVLFYSRSHRAMERLVDQYAEGEKNRGVARAAYIIRDTVKVTGVRQGIAPATAALFYEDLAAPLSGGTGHTLRVCMALGIPHFDQRTWMPWLEQAS